METAVKSGNPVAVSQEEQKRVLENLLGLEPAFRQLVLVDAQEQELGKVSRLSQAASGSLIDRVGSDWFAQVKEGNRYIIEAVADQMALAIENARLLEQTQRSAAYEKLLADITARVRSSLDPQTILQTAVQALGTALGTDRAFVQLRKATPAQLVTPATKGQGASSEKQEPNEQP